MAARTAGKWCVGARLALLNAPHSVSRSRRCSISRTRCTCREAQEAWRRLAKPGGALLPSCQHSGYTPAPTDCPKQCFMHVLPGAEPPAPASVRLPWAMRRLSAMEAVRTSAPCIRHMTEVRRARLHRCAPAKLESHLPTEPAPSGPHTAVKQLESRNSSRTNWEGTA